MPESADQNSEIPPQQQAFDSHSHTQRTAPEADGSEYEFDVSIGLLSYRDEDLIGDLLASIEQSSRRYKYEWLLSYNGSDQSLAQRMADKYPYVRVLENGANLGVAAGRNRLFWNSRAKYTMILDADTLVHEGAIDTLVDTMEQHPEVGIVAPKLVYRDQSLQLSCRAFPRFHHILIEGTSFRRFFEWTGIPARVDMRNVNHDCFMQVDCVYGAAMLIRNKATLRVGGFDEGYHYQYEDYDLCFRFRKAGYETWYQPEATVTHFYERERRGVFHPRVKTHIKSILRFQMRNMWRMSNKPVIHRQDFDGGKVPNIGDPTSRI